MKKVQKKTFRFFMRKSQKKVTVGDRYGRLTVIGRGEYNKFNHIKWRCQCDCGNIKSIIGWVLTGGQSKSCGCLCKEVNSLLHKTHGESHKTTEYNSWIKMKERYFDKNNPAYHDYGGRGITICKRWLGVNGYSNFLKDMGRKPTSKHTLDKYPNNNGNYKPSNCRWATAAQQSRNTRQNVWIEYKGRKMVLADWASELNVKYDKLRWRVRTLGGNNAVEYFLSRKTA